MTVRRGAVRARAIPAARCRAGLTEHTMSIPPARLGFSHEMIETNNFLMIVLTLLVVAVGGPGGDRAAVLPEVHHRGRSRA